MKNKLIILLLLSLTWQTNAQHNVKDYHSITNSSLRWNYLEVGESYSPEHPATTWFTYSLSFQGDTLIDGVEYFKMFKSLIMPEEWEKIAYLRDDYNGKVFFRKDDDIEEKVMYDFSLTEGETSFVYSFSDNIHNFIVDSIRNTTLQNGEIRDVLYISYLDEENNAYFNDIWIEGIGSTFGLLLYEYYHNWIGNYTKRELLCLYVSDVITYKNQEYETCWEVYNGSTVSKLQDKTLYIKPNPVTSISYIDNIPHNSKVEIFDGMGRKLLSEKASKTFKIDKNNFKKGFYIFIIKNGNEYINIIKFTIQ